MLRFWTALLAMLLAQEASAQDAASVPDEQDDVVISGPADGYRPYEVFKLGIWGTYLAGGFDEGGLMPSSYMGSGAKLYRSYLAQVKGCENHVMKQMPRTPKENLGPAAHRAAYDTFLCVRLAVSQAQANPKAPLHNVKNVVFLKRDGDLYRSAPPPPDA